MEKRYAVMGNPIAHSRSPTIHQSFAAQLGVQLQYEKMLIEPLLFAEQVQSFFQQGGSGLNVTVPCKVQAYLLSQEATERCHQAKAANTLWMEKGILHADNTDGIGWLRDIQRYRPLTHSRILIWGAGGATRGILASLCSASPAAVMVVNRSLDKLIDLQKDFPQVEICALNEWSSATNPPYDILIHATSMQLQKDQSLLIPDCFNGKPFCYDLSYQAKGGTPFVIAAEEMGCEATDGLGMLVEQAAEAFCIWHGVLPNTRPVLAQLRKECGNGIS